MLGDVALTHAQAEELLERRKAEDDAVKAEDKAREREAPAGGARSPVAQKTWAFLTASEAPPPPPPQGSGGRALPEEKKGGETPSAAWPEKMRKMK